MADRELTDTPTLTWDASVPTEAKGNVAKQMSIISDSNGLKLDGDSATPGNNKVYGTDGSGVKGWRAEAGGPGGSGGLILVEKKIFTSNLTEYTFSGLNGNADGVYRLIWKIKNNSVVQTFYTIKPNNVTTNQTWRSLTTNATPATTSTQSLLYVGGCDPAAVASGECVIHAAQSVNSVTQNRMIHGAYYYVASGVLTMTQYMGIWAEAAINITSIVFLADQTNGLGNGSEIVLYKYAQS